MPASARQSSPEFAGGGRPAYAGGKTQSEPPSPRRLRWLSARCDEAEGDTAAAETRYQEALDLGRRLGEPGVTASALEGLARTALTTGQRQTATERSAEAAEMRERFHRPAPPHEGRDLEDVTPAPVKGHASGTQLPRHRIRVDIIPACTEGWSPTPLPADAPTASTCRSMP